MRVNNKFIVLIGIYVVLFLWSNYNGGDYYAYEYFGVQKNLVLDYHEYYRLITYSFFHSGIAHLGMNMLALYFLADPVIKFTSERFALIIYLLATIGSGLTVVFLSDSIAIGASGAIFGLFGVIIYYAIKQWRYGYQDLLRQLAPLIIINIIMSMMPGISFSGHLGGLVVGLVGSFIYDKYIKRRY